MRVFLASPYSAPLPATRMRNVHRSLEAAVALIHRGHEPFMPLVSHYIDQFATTSGRPISRDRWMEFCLSWLATCQAVLCLGPSPGVDQEVARALELGIPVYDRVEDVPEVDP